jgi:hypothetical protein
MQENYFDILRGQYLNDFGDNPEGFVISGCAVVANGGNWDVAEGVIFIDGDVHFYPGETNIATTSYLVADSDLVEQRTFRDQAAKNIIVTKQATSQGTIPVTQYISINRATDHKGWKRYTAVYPLANGWLESAATPIEYRKNSDGTISFRGALVFNSGTATSDLFFQNGIAAFPPDLTPGDETGLSGGGQIGTAWVSSGAFAGIQPVFANGSMTLGLFQFQIAGIVAGDVSATNRSVYINLTYSPKNW